VISWVLVFFAKNLAKYGGFLFQKRKVVVFGKFCFKSDCFMLLTPCQAGGILEKLRLQMQDEKSDGYPNSQNSFCHDPA
jgi:hypothetical protein